MVMRSVRSRYIAPPVPSSTVDDGDWLLRSTAPGVFRTFHFNDASQLGDNWSSGVRGSLSYGWQAGTGVGGAPPTVDQSVKVSGAASLKFTLISGTGANGAGTWRTFFSDDRARKFGENTELWAQYRVRVNAGWLQVVERNAGTKMSDFGTGSTNPALVLQTFGRHPWPIIYTGGSSFALYEGSAGSRLLLQNGTPPYCVYPGSAGCFALVADEWVTVKFHIDIGAKRPDGRSWDARVRMWMKRYGQPSQLLVDYGPDTPGYDTNSPIGFRCNTHPGDTDGYPQLILFPYTTNKGANHGSNVHDTAHVWYDEVILSTEEIPDPVDGEPGFPLWRRDKSVGQVYDIPHSAFMGDPTFSTFSPNLQDDIVNNYAGHINDEDNCRWLSAASGGHGKSCGINTAGWYNAVVILDFKADEPTWTMVDPGSSYSKVSINRYYSDGRPNSRHTYATGVYIAKGRMADGLERVGLVSCTAGWAQDFRTTNPCGNVDDGTGPFANGPSFELFRLDPASWFAHDTFDGSVHGWEFKNVNRDLPGHNTSSAGESIVTVIQHPVTHDVYMGGSSSDRRFRGLWKWTAMMDTWTGPHLRSDTQPLYAAAAGSLHCFDRIRNKLVILWSSAGGSRARLIKIDPDTYAIESLTLPQQGIGYHSGAHRLVHDTDNDRYVVAMHEGSPNSSSRFHYRLWGIDPDTGVRTDISGLLAQESRFLHHILAFFPDLHCLVWMTDFRKPIHFMPTK